MTTISGRVCADHEADNLVSRVGDFTGRRGAYAAAGILAAGYWLLPIISGHALFLTYVLLTTRMPVARWSAGLILFQVIYLKALVWYDSTLIGGVLLGLGAVYLYRRMTSSEHKKTNRVSV